MPHPLVVHRKDPHDVYIGRPSRWGNPYVIGRDGTREEVIAKHRAALELRMRFDPSLRATIIAELGGKRLGCHCAPSPCHGDFLAEVANP
jgi:hypothetical protein